MKITYCRVFHKILVDMDNDWRECINNNQHLNIMTIKANISHFISNTLFTFNAILAVLYFLGDYIMHFVFLNADHNDTLRELPIKIKLPFDIQQPLLFAFLVVTVFLHAMLHVSTLSILNGLILTLVNFTFIHLYILIVY